jgi:cell division septation protein DedD
MNAPKSEQIEFEVFPRNAKNDYSYLAGVKSDATTSASQINVVFSPQSAVIICLCLLMSWIASFTLGVEKGKRVVKNTPVAPTVTALAPDKTSAEIASRPAIAATTVVAQDPTVKMTPAPILVAEKTSPAPTATSGYAIQVASVATENSAKSLAEKLTKKGWASTTRPSGKYIIVLAGNFAKQEEAKSGLRELKKTYTDCFIRKI